MTGKRILRCAIYTRKSSEEGLDQSFNSLDAQREACLAFIKSQTQEGWTTLPHCYEDGGYSGGNMDRPGLKRLLGDIERGLVDLIVVYKIDRLTRSLTDFAKIVEILDAKNVSFVSVTQNFNTTSSMGRLTLNVLLSFAQFERELTGERIRDKVAASKKKGLWLGGYPALGYDIADRKLVVNVAEAAEVRSIYERYLALGSVTTLAAALNAEGLNSKRWRTRAGKVQGGGPFSRGALYYLLRNRIYLGETVHRGKVYPGQHEGIVSRALWERVHDKLSEQAPARRSRRTETGALLAGLLHDDRGNVMSPSHVRKRNGTRYRYYTSQALLQGRRDRAGSVARVSAPAIETFVSDRLESLWPFEANGQDDPIAARHRRVRNLVARVEVSKDKVSITVHDTLRRNLRLPTPRPKTPELVITAKTDALILTYATRLATANGGASIETPGCERPGVARRDPALIKAVLRAQQWKDALIRGEAQSLDDLAAQNGCTNRYVRQILNCAVLAPDLVAAILDGRQPRSLTLVRLLHDAVPLDWRAQRRWARIPRER